MNRGWLSILLTLSWCGAQSQNMIFPNLSGPQLESAVVEEYKPKFVELYADAREILYTKVYNINDTVHTIYTDHRLYLPPNEQYPISYLAQNANANGINAEHIYPRSKGAKEEFGNAFSDMHNIAPCRWEVNEARSNFAFAEIPDVNTDRWFYKDQKLNSTESLSNQEIQNYSEVDEYEENFGYFEPRESVKGDIARSVFYFYTMYRAEALQSDPNFFENMKEDLCSWHLADPADEVEIERNQMKAVYQDGKANPFILDCSLANRLYCVNNPVNCQDMSTAVNDVPFELEEPFEPLVKVMPNPNNGIFKLDISNIRPKNYKLEVFDVNGRLMYSIAERLDYFNTINMWNVKTGLYFLHLTDLENGKKYSDVFNIVK